MKSTASLATLYCTCLTHVITPTCGTPEVRPGSHLPHHPNPNPVPETISPHKSSTPPPPACPRHGPQAGTVGRPAGARIVDVRTRRYSSRNAPDYVLANNKQEVNLAVSGSAQVPRGQDESEKHHVNRIHPRSRRLRLNKYGIHHHSLCRC